jgi:hypothetical protein
MSRYALEISTMDLAGNRNKDYHMIVRADSAEKAAEMVRFGILEKSAKVRVSLITEEEPKEFYVEEKTTISKEVRQYNVS